MQPVPRMPAWRSRTINRLKDLDFSEEHAALTSCVQNVSELQGDHGRLLSRFRIGRVQGSSQTSDRAPKTIHNPIIDSTETILHFWIEAYEVGGEEDQLADRREDVDHSKRRQLISYVSRKFWVGASNEVEQYYESIKHVGQPVEQEVEVGRQNDDREKLEEHLRIEQIDRPVPGVP